VDVRLLVQHDSQRVAEGVLVADVRRHGVERGDVMDLRHRWGGHSC
jgi:hypothetical protein